MNPARAPVPPEQPAPRARHDRAVSTGETHAPGAARRPAVPRPDPSIFATRAVPIVRENAGRRFVVRLEHPVPESERVAAGRRIADAAALDPARVARLLAKEPGSPLVRPIELALAERVQRIFGAAGVTTAIVPEPRAHDVAQAFRAAARERLRVAAEQEAAAASTRPRDRHLSAGRLALVAALGTLLGAFLPTTAAIPGDPTSPAVSYLALDGGGAGIALLAVFAAFALTVARRYAGAMAMAGVAAFVVGVDLTRSIVTGGAIDWTGWRVLLVSLVFALLAPFVGRGRGSS